MRCFIAIDIDEQVKKALGRLQEDLQTKVDISKSDVKWVDPEIMHMTLKFLGEIRDESVVEVCRIAEAVAAEYNSFELGIENLGSFGGKNARVLWVGTAGGTENLESITEDLEEKLDHAGWPKEQRKFSGHLTLCRVRNPKAGIKLAQVSGQFGKTVFGSTWVDSISVYQSRLTSTGPVYILLGTYKLK
jgi:2'-5' RNA ligase